MVLLFSHRVRVLQPLHEFSIVIVVCLRHFWQNLINITILTYYFIVEILFISILNCLFALTTIFHFFTKYWIANKF